MKVSLKRPPKYKDKLLVAHGKRNDDPYTLVLGKVIKKEVPTHVEPRWDKCEEHMVSVIYPKKERVHCVPVQKNNRIDNILRKLGLPHYKQEYSYVTYPVTGYVDENIVSRKYGFKPTLLALVSLGEEESAMDIIFPENERSRIFKLDQFFS